MYVQFMKNFYLADSNKLMAAKLISAFWATKNVWLPLSRHGVRRVHEKFSPHWFEGSYDVLGVLRAKTFDCEFLDMMYVEFIKNFYLANSNKLVAVRLISASWA